MWTALQPSIVSTAAAAADPVPPASADAAGSTELLTPVEGPRLQPRVKSRAVCELLRVMSDKLLDARADFQSLVGSFVLDASSRSSFEADVLRQTVVRLSQSLDQVETYCKHNVQMFAAIEEVCAVIERRRLEPGAAPRILDPAAASAGLHDLLKDRKSYELSFKTMGARRQKLRRAFDAYGQRLLASAGNCSRRLLTCSRAELSEWFSPDSALSWASVGSRFPCAMMEPPRRVSGRLNSCDGEVLSGSLAHMLDGGMVVLRLSDSARQVNVLVGLEERRVPAAHLLVKEVRVERHCCHRRAHAPTMPLAEEVLVLLENWTRCRVSSGVASCSAGWLRDLLVSTMVDMDQLPVFNR